MGVVARVTCHYNVSAWTYAQRAEHLVPGTADGGHTRRPEALRFLG